MVDLASAYKKHGQLRKAEELEVQTMELRKRVLGENHLDTITSMANLAFTWKRQGLDNKALELMRECFRLQTLSLGSDHPHTVSSLSVLNEWETEILGFNFEVVSGYE
ncbi:hypothetical protein DM02DRAFT_532500 [Periconia macrospinosa]|uniref:Kinesin light chain n=1 Tax=Periconia macrospinosa TaxID=97972 RepID=A0A2V1DHZ6_9PLEO|nr:hypothetical protein DM02DRAFT_532500 [Periconia macrospinosa]